MFVLSAILGAFLVIIYVLYRLATNNSNYWESKGVPSKKPIFFFGNLKERLFMKISFNDFVVNFYNEMKGKPLAGMYEGSVPVLYVFDPELIKQVLIKQFDHFTDRPVIKFNSKGYLQKMMAALRGTEWKKTRVACTPAFSSGRLKAMEPLVETCGQHMLKYLNHLTQGKDEFELNFKDLLINYTLEVIASTSFGVNLDTFSEQESHFVTSALKFQDIPVIKRLFIILCIMYRLPEWFTELLPLTFFNTSSINFFEKTLIEAIKYRMKNGTRRNDLLQLLLDAQQAPVDIIGEADEEIDNEKREVIDEETAIAQLVFFFIAGFETSSTHLTMACYELAKNKQIQEKVRQDILEHWTEEQLTYEAIQSMNYLDMAMSETLRMYSPVARLEREVTKPVTVGNVKLDIGSKIVIPTAGLHQDPEYYPNPESFIPERFTHEEKMKRPAQVYLAFGAGPRSCIGIRFANISSKICMSYLLKHFEIDICDRTPIPFEYDKQAVFLKSKHDIYLKLKRIT